MLQRVISTVILVPILLVANFWPGGWVFTALVGLLALQALHEYYGGCRKTGAEPAGAFGAAGVLLLLVSAVPLLDPVGVQSAPGLFPGARSGRFFFFGFTSLIMLSLVGELGRFRTDDGQRHWSPLRNLGATWLGIVYIGWLFPFLARLRWLSQADLLSIGWPSTPLPAWAASVEPGAWIVLFLFLLNWTADTAAYLVGKPLGRRKMAPFLSPGKTWEGSAGGFFGCIFVAWLAGRILGFPLEFSLGAGALVGILAQLGDLCKSAMKREIGIKDFGTIIPGHGGVLDRFDSLMFTAIGMYLLWALWPAQS